MKNKKGFTLIELLAVIVILAIIALIATPIVLGAIKKAEKGAFKDSVLNSSNALQYYMLDKNIASGEITIESLKNDKKLKGNFTGGSFIVEDKKTIANYITDGKYCAYGELNNLIISKDCASLDPTEPNVSISLSNITSKSVKVVATCTDPESGIAKYEYSKDNGTNWVDNGTTSTYTFNNLTTGSYNFKVRCTNGAGNTKTSSSSSQATTSITTPTYTIEPSGWTNGNKTVTINYPEGYTNEYSLDGGITWLSYNNPIVFTENGTVIARVTDGTNYINGSSQTVSGIDKTDPEVSISLSNITSKSVKVVATCTDPESGIAKYEYSKDNGTNWVDNGTTSTYTFNNLTTGSYNFKVRCTNGAGTKKVSNKVTQATESISAPTFSVSPSSGWALTKNVTITYPSGVTVKQYSINSGSTWQNYSGSPVTVTYENNTVLARAGDGTNFSANASQTVTELYLTTAQNVSFTPADPNWNVTNVYEALQYLENQLK